MNLNNIGHWIIKKIISSSWYVTLLNFGTNNILLPSKLPNSSINNLLNDNTVKDICKGVKNEIKNNTEIITNNDIWYYKIFYIFKTYWIDIYAYSYSYLILFKASGTYYYVFSFPYNILSIPCVAVCNYFSIQQPFYYITAPLNYISTNYLHNINTPAILQLVIDKITASITEISVSIFGIITIGFIGIFLGPISSITAIFGGTLCYSITWATTWISGWIATQFSIQTPLYVGHAIKGVSLIITVISTFKFRQYLENTWITKIVDESIEDETKNTNENE